MVNAKGTKLAMQELRKEKPNRTQPKVNLPTQNYNVSCVQNKSKKSILKNWLRYGVHVRNDEFE